MSSLVKGFIFWYVWYIILTLPAKAGTTNNLFLLVIAIVGAFYMLMRFPVFKNGGNI